MNTLILTLLTFASIASLAPIPVSAINYCPPLWTHKQLREGSFCYRFFGWKASWREGEATCKNFTICEEGPDGTETSHLVSIGSMEEEEFVTQYWQAMMGPFQGERSVWIGYSKENVKSDWEWTTPIKTMHQNWHPDKPAPKEGGCVQQRAVVYGRPYWTVAPCASWHPFMCKMRAM